MIEYINEDCFMFFASLVGKRAALEVEDCYKEIVIAEKETGPKFADLYKVKYNVTPILHLVYHIPFILNYMLDEN